MEIPTTFLGRLLRNTAAYTDTVVERDVQEIERRFKNEGVSFLTIALPSLCDALDKGLAQGRISRSDFPGFKPRSRRGNLPAFMSGLFMRVFELDGSLLDRPCIESIRSIRQVCRAFKKVELPCSSARQKRAFERYISNDEECSETILDEGNNLRRVAGYLWSSLEDLAHRNFGEYGIFGNGATAERLTAHKRYSLFEWPLRGDSSFPMAQHAVAREDDVETMSRIRLLSKDQEAPVRVVSVPKTLKTPRIISVEPSYMMLRQQCVARPLMRWLEKDCKILNNCIRFTDQSVNRDLARLGSIDGSLATIDLSDASDRVSNALVKHIFQVCPSFLDRIQDARSYRAKLPSGRVVMLKKFASQGSALCFPIEAMVFATIVINSILKFEGSVPSTNRIREITAKIALYGDDIVVPSETAEFVMRDLEAFGLKVNQEKSFHTGLFRESCGGDYYAGADVTPVYVRQWSNKLNTKDPKGIVATISLANQFYMKGLWGVAQDIRDHVERVLGPLARTTEQCGVFTWESCMFNTRLKWNVSSCSFQVKGPSLKFKRTSDQFLDLRGAMLYAFGRRRDPLPDPHCRDQRTVPQSDSGDTSFSIDSYASSIKRKWCGVKATIW